MRDRKALDFPVAPVFPHPRCLDSRPACHVLALLLSCATVTLFPRWRSQGKGESNPWGSGALAGVEPGAPGPAPPSPGTSQSTHKLPFSGVTLPLLDHCRPPWRLRATKTQKNEQKKYFRSNLGWTSAAGFEVRVSEGSWFASCRNNGRFRTSDVGKSSWERKVT